MLKSETPTAAIAMDLALAVSRLRARLRMEQSSVTSGQTVSQLAALGRIVEQGPLTASSLANAEHVRAQSMAETVKALKDDGLIAGEPDPGDRRKVLLYSTEAGRDLVKRINTSRGTWLAEAIDNHVTAHERKALERTVAVLLRLAELESAAAYNTSE